MIPKTPLFTKLADKFSPVKKKTGEFFMASGSRLVFQSRPLFFVHSYIYPKLRGIQNFGSFFLVPGERSLGRPRVFFSLTASIFLMRLRMSRCKIRTINRFSVKSTNIKMNLSWWILIRNTITHIFWFNRFEFDVAISSSPLSSLLKMSSEISVKYH